MGLESPAFSAFSKSRALASIIEGAFSKSSSASRIRAAFFNSVGAAASSSEAARAPFAISSTVAIFKSPIFS